MKVQVVSVLIATYNRSKLLRETLDAVARIDKPHDCDVEFIIIDNNSTDDTRSVVESAASSISYSVLYAFESRQGKSFALNTGLKLAKGDVVALTDDDVVPDPEWLNRIVAAFRNYDVSFVSGKVLPRWETEPPAAMLTGRAEEIWGPLALVDYGNKPVPYDETNFGYVRLPIGANLAFTRQALNVIGGWRPDLGKVNNSLIAGEDYEIFFRLRQSGMFAGLYDPKNVVRHFVPASRLNRQYFRKWFFWHGRTTARMLPETYPEIDFTRARYLLGVPRFLYRQFFTQYVRWVKSKFKEDRLRQVIEEMYTFRHFGIIVEGWDQFRRGMRRRTSRAKRFETGDASSAVGGPREMT